MSRESESIFSLGGGAPILQTGILAYPVDWSERLSMMDADQLFEETETLREQGRHGEARELAQKALTHFEQVLALHSRPQALRGKAVALRQLERPIEALRCAEEAIAQSPQSALYWRTKGAILRDLDRPEEALACYEQGVKLDPRDPLLRSNRINVLVALGQTDQAFDLASQEDPPTEKRDRAAWARARRDLGKAYHKRRAGDQTANLLRAISCHDAALRVWAEGQYPADWAMAHNDLGIAYLDLPASRWATSLGSAIEHLRAATRVWTESDYPADWAMAQNNIGNAYLRLPSGDETVDLAHAIDHYHAALRVWTKSNFPSQWAHAQHNLGVAYSEWQTDDYETNLQRAIDCYEAALTAWTESASPILWAHAQHSLGAAYCQKGGPDHGSNLRRAVAYFDAALRVRRPQTLPFEARQTSRALGDLHFRLSDWRRALTAYQKAVDVAERLRLEALGEVGRRSVWQEDWHVFDRGMLSAVRDGQPSEALRLAECSKARNLVDRLWRRDIAPKGAVHADWLRYLALQQQAQGTEKRLARNQSFTATDQQTEPRVSSAVYEEMIDLRRQAQELEGRFARLDPDYAPLARPLDFEEILAITRRLDAVLVEFRVTGEGTLVLLAGPEDHDLRADQVVERLELTSRSLRLRLFEWLRHQESHEAGETSTAVRQRLHGWSRHLLDALQEIGQELVRPVADKLHQLYPRAERLILVPSQGLTLFPLHACPYQPAANAARTLLDDYSIAYAPSCQTLARCLARAGDHRQPPKTLFAVQNPDGSLDSANWEVERASRFFSADSRHILSRAAASRAATLDAIGYGEEKLFSCHGVFDPNDVLRSRLQLAGDDALTVDDVMRLDLRGTRLVVMSACRTAVSDPADFIDEYQGLPAAFLTAGAEMVVGSLWSVSDVSTALLMSRFHGNLYERRMLPAAALRSAQLRLRDANLERLEEEWAVGSAKRATAEELQTDWATIRERMGRAQVIASTLGATGQFSSRPFAHPYFWAPFQCIGLGW